MTVENEQQTEQQAQDTIKTLKTDIFGVEIELPIDTAKALIAKRDERTKAFRDLDAKVKEFETRNSDIARQAEAQKAALEGRIAEAEALFAQKHQEKLTKMQSAVARNALKAAFKSSDEFVGDDAALGDAIALVLSAHSFEVADDLSIKNTTGKTVEEVVSEFIAARPAFRKARPAVRGQPGTPATGNASVGKKPASALNSIAAGLAKHLGT